MIKLIRLKRVRHVARMGEKKGAYMNLVGKRKENMSLGRSRCKEENNIKMNLQIVENNGLD